MKKKILKSATSFYLHSIKQKMQCPSCFHEMYYNSIKKEWHCRTCSYHIDRDVFENDYVFWHCDECGKFLNNQESFDYDSDSFKCNYCGYENDISQQALYRCEKCGTPISIGDDSFLCPDCKIERLEKVSDNLYAVSALLKAVSDGLNQDEEDSDGIEEHYYSDYDDYYDDNCDDDDGYDDDDE